MIGKWARDRHAFHLKQAPTLVPEDGPIASCGPFSDADRNKILDNSTEIRMQAEQPLPDLMAWLQPIRPNVWRPVTIRGRCMFRWERRNGCILHLFNIAPKGCGIMQRLVTP